MEKKADLGWVDFYMELADKLLPFKDGRQKLLEKIKAKPLRTKMYILSITGFTLPVMVPACGTISIKME